MEGLTAYWSPVGMGGSWVIGSAVIVLKTTPDGAFKIDAWRVLPLKVRVAVVPSVATEAFV